jgi:hypothetical protein
LDYPERHFVFDFLDREAGIVFCDNEAFDLPGALIARPDDVNGSVPRKLLSPIRVGPTLFDWLKQ